MTDTQNMAGMTFSLPEGWGAEAKGDIVFLAPEQIQRLHGLYTLSLSGNAPEASPSGTREDAKYFVEMAEGGNGGPEHFLTIWRENGDQWLVLKAHQQTDPAPDFSEAWAVFDSVSTE